MKLYKKIIIIFVLVIILSLLLDFSSILIFHRPIFAIKKSTDSIYSGLFYDVYDCTGKYSGIKIMPKGSKFLCPMEDEIGKVTTIVDTSQTIQDFTCASALEQFYKDEIYIYYYPCIKGEYVKVKYESGFEETVKEALKRGSIKISDLDNYEIEYIKEKNNITVVPTMLDNISNDTFWAPTFQLVWNDLKNEIGSGEIKVDQNIKIIDNLNLEIFNENMLNPDYYYKKVGLKTLELKKQIENDILKKFNQTSDILDNFDWNDDALNENSNGLRYFLYAMLYRKFEFEYQFDQLENGTFNIINDVKYFGINKQSNTKLYDQVKILYYNDENNFAVILKTKNNDEVILVKNPIGSNFDEIYQNMNKNAKKYTGSSYLNLIDQLKIPYINVNVLKEYAELENQILHLGNGNEFQIMKALQSIKFTLNEKGGEIKSEAGIDGIANSIAGDFARNFYFDDTFAIFLREENKEVPYFAGIINDISKFQ